MGVTVLVVIVGLVGLGVVVSVCVGIVLGSVIREGKGPAIVDHETAEQAWAMVNGTDTEAPWGSIIVVEGVTYLRDYGARMWVPAYRQEAQEL